MKRLRSLNTLATAVVVLALTSCALILSAYSSNAAVAQPAAPTVSMNTPF